MKRFPRSARSRAPFLPRPHAHLRLLVVTYYFPPSGGAGVQRPTKWVRYLPDHGVAPTVLTVRAGAYPHLDRAMLADVPPGVPVVRTAAPDPFGVYARLTGRDRSEAVSARTHRVGDSEALAERASRWIRANVFVPDARVGWVPFAMRAARRLHREAPFDAVVTTGPPHSAHLVGRALHRAAGVPWVADFRDPWTAIHYLGALGRSGWASRRDRALEASVLAEADALTTVSDPLRADLLALAPGARVETIRNGFDPADFSTPSPAVRRDRFEVTYVGTLFGVPAALLDAMVAVPEVHLRVVGTAPEALADAAAARGLADRVTVEPTVGHTEAVARMRAAPLLLLTVEAAWSYAAAVVPGKTYEYLAAARPVLGIGPPGEAADILRATGAGAMLDPADAAAVTATLRTHVDAWTEGSPLDGAAPDVLAPYSRDVQAGELARLLRDVARGGRS